METSVALERLLSAAGLSQEQGRWLSEVLDGVRDWPDGSDGLAGALLRWKHRAEVDAYEAGLKDASDGLHAVMLLTKVDGTLAEYHDVPFFVPIPPDPQWPPKNPDA